METGSRAQALRLFARVVENLTLDQAAELAWCWIATIEWDGRRRRLKGLFQRNDGPALSALRDVAVILDAYAVDATPVRILVDPKNGRWM